MIEFAGSMLSTLSRRVMARGLRPSPLALHRVRMCQSAAAQPEVKVTIEEPAAAVSDDETAEVALEKALRPKEIVEQLDRYIIGQPEAKRAVAVAMRNRWRRQRVASPLKEEVCRRAPSTLPAPRAVSPHALRLPAMHACAHPTARARADLPQISPKNILMIGPTGKAACLTRGPRWRGRDRSPTGRPAQARPKARARPRCQTRARARACHGPDTGGSASAVVSRRLAWFKGPVAHTSHRALRPAPHPHRTRTSHRTPHA